jgi:putative glutathione S-transferase
VAGEGDYRVHTRLNPSGIVPAGPDLSAWLAPHGREGLGGRAFGDGTPPGPPPAEEEGPAITAREGRD